MLPAADYKRVIHKPSTLDFGIDVGQEINVGPGKFGKKNKCRVLSNHGA